MSYSIVMSGICYDILYILFVACIIVIVAIVSAFVRLFVFRDFLLCFVSALCIVSRYACTASKAVHIWS